MPVNRHTSGVSVFGSDETNAARRQRRRRMRAHRGGCADRLGYTRHKVHADYWDRDKSDYLFGNTVLEERMRGRGVVFLRDHATDYVCATLALARFAAGRIGAKARRGRQLERHNQQCQDDCKQDQGCLPHCPMISTNKASRRSIPQAGVAELATRLFLWLWRAPWRWISRGFAARLFFCLTARLALVGSILLFDAHRLFRVDGECR
jgi:hypothetical protein